MWSSSIASLSFSAICTHFLPAEILTYLRKKKVLNLPIGVVVIDFDAHALWLYRDVDWHFVACEETKIHLAALGIPPEAIHVTGIPIDPVFAISTPKGELRRALGLDPRRTTILVSAGGFGMEPVESLVQALQKIRHPIQLVIVCGRNAALAWKIDALLADEARFGRMRQAVMGLARPHAASDIVSVVSGAITRV